MVYLVLRRGDRVQWVGVGCSGWVWGAVGGCGVQWVGEWHTYHRKTYSLVRVPQLPVDLQLLLLHRLCQQ